MYNCDFNKHVSCEWSKLIGIDFKSHVVNVSKFQDFKKFNIFSTLSLDKECTKNE